MARAAIASGADGLLVEVHHKPEDALCDGTQSLHIDEFSLLMDELRVLVDAVGREI